MKIIREVVRFVQECKDDNVTAYAAQSAYFTLLSLIPFLLFFAIKNRPFKKMVAKIQERRYNKFTPFFGSALNCVRRSVFQHRAAFFYL